MSKLYLKQQLENATKQLEAAKSKISQSTDLIQVSIGQAIKASNLDQQQGLIKEIKNLNKLKADALKGGNVEASVNSSIQRIKIELEKTSNGRSDN